MANLGEVRQKVLNDLTRTDLASEANDAINEAIKTLSELNNFWFQDSEGQLTTVAQKSNYNNTDGFPEYFSNITYAELIYSGSNLRIPLTKRTFDYIRDADPGNFYSQPTDYAIYENQLWLYPSPNLSNYTIRFFNTNLYEPLEDDSDTNAFTIYASSLVAYEAQKILCLSILRDESQAQRLESNIAQQVKSLNRATRQKKATSRVISKGF